MPAPAKLFKPSSVGAGASFLTVVLLMLGNPFLGRHLWHSFADIAVNWKDSETLEVSYRWDSENPGNKTKNEQTVPKKGKVRINYIVKGSD